MDSKFTSRGDFLLAKASGLAQKKTLGVGLITGHKRSIKISARNKLGENSTRLPKFKTFPALRDLLSTFFLHRWCTTGSLKMGVHWGMERKELIFTLSLNIIRKPRNRFYFLKTKKISRFARFNSIYLILSKKHKFCICNFWINRLCDKSVVLYDPSALTFGRGAFKFDQCTARCTKPPRKT